MRRCPETSSDPGDPRQPRAPFQIFDDVMLSLVSGVSHALVQVEPLLEIQIDHMVAADEAVERARSAPDIDALKTGHLTRLRRQPKSDVLEILELRDQVADEIAAVWLHS